MIEESSTKRFAQKRIVKVGKAFPRSNATDSDFGNEDMDVRIPLKTAAEGVEDTDKTGSNTIFLSNCPIKSGMWYNVMGDERWQNHTRYPKVSCWK